MALQTSGAISLSDIQGEFGGANPISLSEYYGADSGIPTSGAISLSDFYGASSITHVYLTASSGSWVVPAGVSSITAYCVGGGGRSSNSDDTLGDLSLFEGTGGEGGYAKATISVTAGETLYYRVGGAGGLSSGGVNGGGTGGTDGIYYGETYVNAGGGGGYSGLFRGSVTVGNALIIAGGGAGGGGAIAPGIISGKGGYGGKGGGQLGSDGESVDAGNASALAGYRASLTVGGSGGVVLDGTGHAGTAGTALQGGRGYGTSYEANEVIAAGGGGGGGAYGGGGGACARDTDAAGAGGGGGSGKLTGTNTSAYAGNYTGNPFYDANYGNPAKQGRIVIEY